MKSIRRFAISGLLGSLLISLALGACGDEGKPPIPISLFALVADSTPYPYYNAKNWHIRYESIQLQPYDLSCTTAENKVYEVFGSSEMDAVMETRGAQLGYFDAGARDCTTFTFGIPEPEQANTEQSQAAFATVTGQATSPEGTTETFRFNLSGFTDRAIGTQTITGEAVDESSGLARIHINLETINWLTFVDFSELPTNSSGERIMPAGSPYAHNWRNSLLDLDNYDIYWSD